MTIATRHCTIWRAAVWLLLGGALGACATPPASPATGAASADGSGSGNKDAATGGDAGSAVETTGSDAAAAADGGANDQTAVPADADAGQVPADTLGDVAVDAKADSAAAGDGPDVDFDLLDPQDVAADAEDIAPPPTKGLEVVYAHTSSQLYKLEKNAFVLVGNFTFTKSAGQVTDIALDEDGNMFAVTFNDVFSCDKAAAKCTWLAQLPQSFNGLTVVPKDTAVPGKSALIGIANSGDWNLIEVNGGAAKVTKLGSYGGFTSSGDAFSVEKVGTYATVKAGIMAFTDKLVQVDPATGAVLKTVGDTGVSDLWGVAWSGGVLYGFASSGKVYSLDIQTGKASTIPGLLVPNGVSWWGAGVSTRAALSGG